MLSIFEPSAKFWLVDKNLTWLFRLCTKFKWTILSILTQLSSLKVVQYQNEMSILINWEKKVTISLLPAMNLRKIKWLKSDEYSFIFRVRN